MDLGNRFVRSAIYDGSAEDGYVTDKQVNLYSTLSKGGVGLIITGITYVHESGDFSKFQNSIAGDECIDGFKKLNSVVHQWGARIVVQLFHAGREARFPKSSDRVPMGPSFAETDPHFRGKCRPMTETEVWEVVR